MSSNGKWIATTGFTGPIVRDAQTLRTLRTANLQFFESIAFHPANPKLAICLSSSGSITIWDFAVDEYSPAIKQVQGACGSLDYSPDGRHLLAAGSDGRLRISDTETGQIVLTIDAHPKNALAKFSSDGRQIISCGTDQIIKTWDTSNGFKLGSHAGAPCESITAISGRPRVAVFGDRKGALYDVATGERLKAFGDLNIHNISGVAISPNADRLVVGSKDGVITLLDVESGTVVQEEKTSLGEITAVNISVDGRSTIFGTRSGSLYRWRSTDSSFESTAALGAKHGARFTRDQSKVISVGPDGQIEYWDARTGNLLKSFARPGHPKQNLASTSDGVFAGYDGKSAIEILANDGDRFQLKANGLSSKNVHVAFSRDGRFLVSAGDDSTIRIWNMEGRRLEKTLSADGARADGCAAISPTGSFVVSKGWKSEIFIWDVRKSTVLRKMDGFIFDCADAFAGDADNIVLQRGSNVQIINLATNETIQSVEDSQARSNATSDDGQFIASAQANGGIFIWDAKNAVLLHKLIGHSQFSASVRFSSDGARLVTTGFDHTLRIWDVAAGTLLVTIFSVDATSWVALTPEGFFTASSKSAGSVLSAVRGVEATGIDRVYDALYRPDLVREKLAGDPNGLMKAGAAKLDLDKVIASGMAPTVSITSPKTHSDAEDEKITVEGEITDQGGGGGRVEWKINGVTQGDTEGKRGLTRVEGGETLGTMRKVTQVLALEPGENVIELVVYNAANLIASEPATIKVTLAESAVKTPPKLYVLAVGINDYYDSRMRLTYAVPDATTLSGALQQAGAGHYDSVEATTLTDAQVTVAGLEQAFEELSRKVRPRDVMVFFAAGHGRTVDGRYYYLPRDFRYQTEASIADNGIGQNKWQAWFAKIAARKSILIYDTCESGTLTASGEPQMAALTRSGLEQQAALGRLIQATGRTVLTAATSDRPALEGYKGHGVFTYAIIDGLARADRNGNGLIEVTELAGYVDAAVPEITQKAFGQRQLPQMSIQGSDFALAKKIDELVADTGIAPPSTDVPTKPTHVALELLKVFKDAGNAGEMVLELKPGTTFAIVKTENGWSLIARDGKAIGYVEEAKAQRLQ